MTFSSKKTWGGAKKHGGGRGWGEEGMFLLLSSFIKFCGTLPGSNEWRLGRPASIYS